MRAGALRAQIRVAGEGLFGWMVPGVFIRVEPVALGGGAQDSSALPHDFLIAEVYKEKDNENLCIFSSFLMSL
jgi:hypothetical protein